jgi:hypothetical protein
LENEEELVSKLKNTFLLKLGGILVVLSFVLYGALLLVPLLPFSAGIKVSISAGLVILGEVSFWIGGLIVGKEVITKYKQKLNPLRYFKNKKGN